MGSVTKQRSGSLYGTLLHVYPRKFREHFGPTMEQTLDDMLAGESTRSGRMAVWARTFADLPVSAAKEHITDGREISMNRNTKILLGCVVGALLLANLASFWYGNLHARSAAGVERVTPVQLADAMQQDGFYSTYGDTALLFSGKVTTVQQKDGTQLVTFYTGRPYTVSCQLTGQSQVRMGQEISVATTGGNADRLSHGVLLHNCLLNQ